MTFKRVHELLDILKYNLTFYHQNTVISYIGKTKKSSLSLNDEIINTAFLIHQ